MDLWNKVMTNPTITPALLFLNYWKVAAKWKASLIANVQRPSQKFREELFELLKIPDGQTSTTQIEALIKSSKDGKRRGRVLVLMEVLDNFFYQIHPRTLYDTDMSYINLEKLHWLKQLQTARTLTGCYCHSGGRKLIPRGPLTREFRPISASSADCFRDRFSALSVVESNTSVNEVPVSISIKVKTANSPQGIATEGAYRDRHVAFMPLAEVESHLSVNQRTNQNISFVDFKASSALDVPKKTLDIIRQIAYSDIIMAPELVVSEADSKLIEAGIRNNTGHFRAFIAGSGHTSSKEKGQSWNKSDLYNGAGGLVFGQRKIWLADIPRARATEFGLDLSAPRLVEDNASGEELIVADLDGFGRCIILICQDLNASPMAEYVIGNYQPDWVFIPILDVGVSIGRWFHQRILDLSNSAPSRFLVCSSLSLADKASYKDVACGLAFGPLCEQKSEKDEELDAIDTLDAQKAVAQPVVKKSDPKRMTLSKIDSQSKLGFGIVCWDDAWISTRIVEKK